MVLFELLSGRKPFLSDDFIEVVRMHREAAPPTLNEIAGEGTFSKELEAVIKKALAKSPDDRFQTAEEFTAALDETPEGFRAKEAEMAISPDPKGKTLPIGTQSPFRQAGEITQPVSRATRSSLPIGFFGILTAALAVAVITIVIIVRRSDETPPQKTVVHVTDSTPKETATAKKTGTKTDARSLPSKPVSHTVNTVKIGVGDVESEDINSEAAVTPPSLDEDAEDTGASEPEVKSIADAKRLIKAGEKERALAGLRRLRREQPKNAQIVLLIGELFYDKVWWSDALDYYSEAIRLNPSFKKKLSIQRDVIATLSSDKTAGKASYVLRQVIGKAALPMLRRAAKKDDSWAVRKRADALVKKMR